MKFLFASDSFKGSLSSSRSAELLTAAAHEVFPEAECFHLPVADGGEGTIAAVVEAVDGEMLSLIVSDPLGTPVTASYGKTSDSSAVIEMAAASGLTLIPEEKRNPLYTSTRGTGEMILDALNRGFREISIAIGGSATNDGGTGCLSALGVRFLDAEGRLLPGRGIDLEHIASIDMSGLDPRFKETRLTVMCDVDNPLCGPSGATRVFGKQKGGTPEILDRLEAGMQNYRDVLFRTFGIDADSVPGAGAAGGLGAALSIVLNGTMRSGIETVLDLIGFDALLNKVDLVVTGEGRTDSQSVHGKVMHGIGLHARKAGVPAIGLSGSLGDGADAIFSSGISSIMTSVDRPMELNEAMEKAEQYYLSAAVRMFRFLKVGMELKEKIQ